MANPLAPTRGVIDHGRTLFQANCSTCHGLGADGKGPSAAGLDPPPANFHDETRFERHGDDYLFWRVSSGKPGTAMPAFAATLSEEDRWAILRYLRTIPGARQKEGT